MMETQHHDRERRERGGTSGMRSASLRRSNLATVFAELRSASALSRADLVERTGLTRGAVGSLVTELVELDLVTETAPPQSDGGARLPGRPSVAASIDTTKVAALAIEVGVEEIAVAVVSLVGEVLDTARLQRDRLASSAEQVFAEVANLVRLVGFDRDVVGDRRIVGIGVAVAGLVRPIDGVIATAPNLGWADVEVRRIVGDALGTDIGVHVGNEADLSAVAESRFGAGVEASSMVFVSGEVGVGGGLIIDGHLLSGRSGFAGEVGHFPVNPDGLRCACGAIGCWETEVGERALLARAGRNTDGGARAVGALLDEAYLGDDLVLSAMAEHGQWIARGVTGLINVFDPDVVVLGGLFSAMWPHVEVVVRDVVEASHIGGRSRGCPVLPAHLGVNGRLVGAAELAYETLLSDPSVVAGH